MIPKTTPTNVTTSGLSNDTTSFSIQASGKAFRALIDGLYTDKVAAPVRELLTNAYDSHIDAGIKDRPIKVLVPTRMDPTFGVRDFGTGMSHEDVTGLYSTLFASSKESTNEQVGMLGLGSKSPFAYTDAFTVTAWDGINKRTYMAFIEQDVPKITMVDNSPSTEEKGIEVKFPVAPNDISNFVQAVRNMVVGFSVTPEFDTDAVINSPTPILEGSFYRVFKQSDFGWSAQCRVQQGIVTYPVEHRYSSNIPSGMLFIVEVPIGSVDVAISREALSMDDATEETVRQSFKKAWDDALSTMSAEFNKIKNPLARAKYAHGFNDQWKHHITGMIQAENLRLPGSVGSWTDSLGNVKTNQTLPPSELISRAIPGSYVMTSKKSTVTSFRYPVSGSYEFILDDMDVPRRRSRIISACSGNGRKYVVPAGKDQAKWVQVLKNTLALVDTDFVKVEDLDDVRKGQGANTKKRDKITEVRARINAGTMWVTSMRGKYDLPEFGLRRTGGIAPSVVPHKVWLEFMAVHHISNYHDDVVHMTESEVARVKPAEDQELSKVLKKYILDNYITEVTRNCIIRTAREFIGSSANGWDERHALFAHFDKTVGKVKDSFAQIENFLANLEEIDYDGCKAVAKSFHDEWQDKYPLLMIHPEAIDPGQYIIQQDKQEENNNS